MLGGSGFETRSFLSGGGTCVEDLHILVALQVCGHNGCPCYCTRCCSPTLQGETVRPGILVLINDADWELMGQLDYQLQTGDNVVFISTLHGG